MAEEEKKELVFEELTDFGFGTGKAYVLAPVAEPLEAYVSGIKKTEQLNDKYKKTSTGEDNPTYGLMVPTLVVEFTLEESEAKGQRYSSWVPYSYNSKDKEFYLALSDKSNMGKISQALTGDIKGVQGLRPEEVIGSRLRVSLRPSKNNADKLMVDLTKLFATKNPEKRITVATGDIVLKDIPEAEDAMSAFDTALEG